MNSNDNIQPTELELIEKYLLNELPATEKTAFEQRLSTDNALQQRVQELRLLLVGIQETSLAQDLQQFHQGIPAAKESATPVVALWWKKIAVAASIVLVVAAGWWWFGTQGSKEEKLYATYFKPDPGLSTTMGVADNYAFEKAMIDYKTGNYPEAISSWEKQLAANPNSDTLHYFIGAATLANKEAAKSVAWFEKVIATGNSAFLKDAYWYKAMALLYEGKREEAVVALGYADHPQKEALLKKLQP